MCQACLRTKKKDRKGVVHSRLQRAASRSLAREVHGEFEPWGTQAPDPDYNCGHDSSHISDTFCDSTAEPLQVSDSDPESQQENDRRPFYAPQKSQPAIRYPRLYTDKPGPGAFPDENHPRLPPVPIYVGSSSAPPTEVGSLPRTPSKAYMACAQEGGDAQPPNAHPCMDISARVPASIPEVANPREKASSPHIFFRLSWPPDLARTYHKWVVLSRASRAPKYGATPKPEGLVSLLPT
ncbi:hypothetical protein MRX96_054891 [Rhipicephalus microplus]